MHKSQRNILQAAVPLYPLPLALLCSPCTYRILFAPPPFCLPSCCRWMALGDTWLTPCNRTVTDQFGNKFKYRAQHDRFPDEDAIEVDGSHVSQKKVSDFVARYCVARCQNFVLYPIFCKDRKPFFLDLQGKNQRKQEQTNAASETKNTTGHHSTATHGQTAVQDTAHGSRAPQRTTTHSNAAGHAATHGSRRHHTPQGDHSGQQTRRETAQTNTEWQEKTGSNTRHQPATTQQENTSQADTMQAPQHSTPEHCTRRATKHNTGRNSPTHHKQGHTAQQHQTQGRRARAGERAVNNRNAAKNRPTQHSTGQHTRARDTATRNCPRPPQTGSKQRTTMHENTRQQRSTTGHSPATQQTQGHKNGTAHN